MVERHRACLVGFCLISLSMNSLLWSEPTTAHDAEMVVTGWLRADGEPLDTILGKTVGSVETFCDGLGAPVYYVVYLEPSGFVIVSADDRVEPIVAFADDGTYECDPGNPLCALVTSDLAERVETVESTARESISAFQASKPAVQQKWADLIALAQTSQGQMESFDCTSPPSDVRVAPLTTSKWGQSNTSGPNASACYNFYTPQLNGFGDLVQWSAGSTSNYPCGCVAVAMAQLMYSHEYPNESIRQYDFSSGQWLAPKYYITVGRGTAVVLDQRTARGGDGSGGPYRWGDMESVPTGSAGSGVREAIGALCYDAGLSVSMHYAESGSDANTLDAADALQDTFRFESAVKGYKDGADIGAGLMNMINPNLDAECPVIIGVRGIHAGGDAGHAMLVDGYGYNGSAAYHHLNMGWRGSDDCWYNLPQFTCAEQQLEVTRIYKCVYNIFTSASGEIISGRVTDASGRPIVGAVVVATGQALDSATHTDTTDARGIYALVGVQPNTTYFLAVAKPGYEFGTKHVTTQRSSDYSSTSGNKWGVDFTGTPANGGNPVVLTFEGITVADQDYIPSGYGGLFWSGSFCVHNSTLSPDSGYGKGCVTPKYVAYNGGENPVEFSGGPFDLVGAHMTAAWRDALRVTVTGYRSGSPVYNRTVVLSSREATWVQFDYMGVDQVTFSSEGGAENPAYDGGGAHFVLDDMTINPVAAPTGVVRVFEETFPSLVFDTSKWKPYNNAEISTSGYNEPSSPYSLRLNGLDVVESRNINLSLYSAATLSYSFEREGGGEMPDDRDDLILEGFDGSEWIELDYQPGWGLPMTCYKTVAVGLPLSVLRADFKLRIRSAGDPPEFDDWFVDNIRIDATEAPVQSSASIVGHWRVDSWRGSQYLSAHTISFTFDGRFTTDSGNKGTWTQSGGTVSWVYDITGTRYDGTLSSDDAMSGTMVSYAGWSGTWEAARQ